MISYPTVFFNHLVLPLPEDWDHSDIVSLETAHGQYPVFPSRDDPHSIGESL